MGRTLYSLDIEGEREKPQVSLLPGALRTGGTRIVSPVGFGTSDPTNALRTAVDRCVE